VDMFTYTVYQVCTVITHHYGGLLASRVVCPRFVSALSLTVLCPAAAAAAADDNDTVGAATAASAAAVAVVSRAVDAGAGYFFQPTVLSGVTPAMLCFQEETFGARAATPSVPVVLQACNTGT
jgi:hypothetical protein